MLQHTKIDLISLHRRQALATAAADSLTLAQRPPRPSSNYYHHNYQTVVIGKEELDKRATNSVSTRFVSEPSVVKFRNAIPLPGLVPSSPTTIIAHTSFSNSSSYDLNRIDSGNSSLSTNVDSLSNASTLSGESNTASTFNSVTFDANSYHEDSAEDTYLYLKIYVPEAQSEVI